MARSFNPPSIGPSRAREPRSTLTDFRPLWLYVQLGNTTFTNLPGPNTHTNIIFDSFPTPVHNVTVFNTLGGYYLQISEFPGNFLPPLTAQSFYLAGQVQTLTFTAGWVDPITGPQNIGLTPPPLTSIPLLFNDPLPDYVANPFNIPLYPTLGYQTASVGLGVSSTLIECIPDPNGTFAASPAIQRDAFGMKRVSMWTRVNATLVSSAGGNPNRSGLQIQPLYTMYSPITGAPGHEAFSIYGSGSYTFYFGGAWAVQYSCDLDNYSFQASHWIASLP